MIHESCNLTDRAQALRKLNYKKIYWLKREKSGHDIIRQVETLYATFEKLADMSRCWSEQKPRTRIAERQAKCSIMYLLLPLLGGVAR